MDEDKFVYELVTCEHLEAARTYHVLVKNKLADLEGFEVRLEPADSRYRVLFIGDEAIFKSLENFLGSIIVRLFFF